MNKVRERQKQFAGSDVAAYSKTLFGMFSSEKVIVTAEAENGFAGILIDRFGKEIGVTKVDADHFRTKVDVVPGEIFIGWIFPLIPESES